MTIISIPLTLIAGDTFKVVGGLADYDADTWTLTMSLNGNESHTIVATADGTDYQILATAAITAAYSAGIFDYVLYVQDIATGLEQYTVDSGQIAVSLRADIAGVGDKRSHYQIVLENIEAVLEKRSSRDQDSYSIGGRSLSRTPITDLLQLRSYYKQRVLETTGKSRPKVKQNWMR